ncbi:MAG TPA: amino acid ABC transporter substrate-binding protein [Chloroflexota bacterium]|nr:amino acid ABC transporter substrate-binding protein [Chloroflexota bacterium]
MTRRSGLSRRDFLRIAAGAGGAAALAACGPSAAQTGRAGGGQPAASGAAGAASGSTSGPIKIGASIAATGSYGRTGLYQQEAYQLWEKQVNARGGLLGRPVQMIIRDDQSDASTGQKLYEQLITDDKVDLILGPYSSQVTQAAANVAEKYRYPMLAAGASASDLWTQGNKKYLFGVYSIAESYFTGVLEIAQKEGYRTLAVANESTLFPKSTAQGTVKLAKDKGLQVVLEEQYPEKVTDVSSIIQKAKAANAEVLVGGSYLPDALLLTRQSKELSYNPKLMAYSVGAAMPDYGEALGKDADYVFGPSMWEPELQTPGNQDFVRAYKEMFNREPDYHSAAGYSACQVLEAAVKAVGALDNQKLRDWIAAAEVETVLPGKFKVDANGMMVGHEAVTIQWQGADKVLVWPAKYATGSYKLPTPPWSQRA